MSLMNLTENQAECAASAQNDGHASRCRGMALLFIFGLSSLMDFLDNRQHYAAHEQNVQHPDTQAGMLIGFMLIVILFD